MADLRLPDGGILLHIGPPKTGTTTIQAALGANRDRMRAQGVVYPGEYHHELSPAMAAASGQVDPGKSFERNIRRWHDHLREIRQAGARLGVLSSEFYTDAKPERIPWLLEQLGPTHVVVTLRPVVRILASQWQQYMQNNRDLPFEEWLEAILAEPVPGAVTPSFWKRHRHDLLVERWAGYVGPENLTVVVADERDERVLLRSFERLLGLADGTLVLPDQKWNRSLTLEELELVRHFNREFSASGFGLPDYTRFVRYGAAREVQTRPVGPDDHRVLTPEWAVGRACEIGAGMAERIAATGVRVLGDLSVLGDPALAPPTGENPTVDRIPLDLAAAFSAGLTTHLAGVQGRVDPVAGIGPVERALVRRHRAVNFVAFARWADTLRASLATVEDELAEERTAATASRTDVLRELRARVRRRLRRSSGTQAG